MINMLNAAKAAKRQIAALTTEEKNAALNAMADALLAQEAEILAANALDLEAAKGVVPDVMLDRLLLTPARIAGMAQGIREVAALPDPVGGEDGSGDAGIRAVVGIVAHLVFLEVHGALELADIVVICARSCKQRIFANCRCTGFGNVGNND